MLSIIIPSYFDPFLNKTIESLLKNASGKIEIIPVIDGYTPESKLPVDKRINPLYLPVNLGMRAAINAGIAKVKGKFIMKCDSHCLFGNDYDKILTENCKENWLVIPRRYSLDDGKWERNDKRPIWDYHYLTYPLMISGYGICITNQNWERRTRERIDPKYDIDDTMTFQGSCWVANRKYFLKRVGKLNDSPEAYGPFGGEQVEIGLKYWLGGGEVKVVKKAWYAHLSKQPRHYNSGVFTGHYKRNSQTAKRRTWSAKHWMNGEEPNMIHPISWLVEKFWPVPTWPEDRNLWVFPK